MAYIALYWSVMLIGYFVGSKCRSQQDKFNFVSTVMLVCISLMVLLMGINMGSNKQVIDNLGNIGIVALLMTVILMIGAVVSVTITRKIFKIDRHGYFKDEIKSDNHIDTKEQPNEKEKSSHLMTILIIGFVIIGLVIGYFVVIPADLDMVKFSKTTGLIMTVGLSFMLMVIGFDMGLSGTVVKQFKSVGFRIFVFPIAIIIGTAITGVICGLITDLSIRESLAVSFGYGWYTFAPIAITNAGFPIAGAVSFMHNVFRELGGIVLIPLLAGKIGYLEVTSLPGVAAMDICMPIVERATRQDIIAYSFVIGMVESLMVPILVPLVIGG